MSYLVHSEGGVFSATTSNSSSMSGYRSMNRDVNSRICEAYDISSSQAILTLPLTGRFCTRVRLRARSHFSSIPST